MTTASQVSTTTLRHILTQEKPEVPSLVNRARPTSNVKWPELEKLIIWDEFTLANLNESYSHVLDSVIHGKVLQASDADQVLGSLVIDTSKSVDQLMSWNHDMMRLTVGFGEASLKLHPGIALQHSHTNANRGATANIPDPKRQIPVGHVVEIDHFPSRYLVVGISLPSAKFNSKEVTIHLDPKATAARPLRQLANVCRATQTRYDYIQTEKEMVVCCFSEGAGDDLGVAMMPISWSTYGVENLTTDLALWYLCMLAMTSPDHRRLVKEGDMVKINEWELFYNAEELCWKRRHRYSDFEKPADEPMFNFASPENFDDDSYAAFVDPNPDVGSLM